MDEVMCKRKMGSSIVVNGILIVREKGGFGIATDKNPCPPRSKKWLLERGGGGWDG